MVFTLQVKPLSLPTLPFSDGSFLSQAYQGKNPRLPETSFRADFAQLFHFAIEKTDVQKGNRFS